MFLYKIPPMIQSMVPSLKWRIKTSGKEVSLTFDDGPVVGVTDWVLQVLTDYKVRATFFCVGENAVNHPDIIERIVEGGHSIGNHTYNHLDGWSTGVEAYYSNVMKVEEELGIFNLNSLFRPPYGKLLPGHIKKLKVNFDIIMWEVLIGDYRRNISVEVCLRKSLNAISPGSIILFHDSLKAEANLRLLLPAFIEDLLNRGFVFKQL